MGLKQLAREAMQAAGVPILPGSQGVVRSTEEALEIAEEIGYPVIYQGIGGRRRPRYARCTRCVGTGGSTSRRRKRKPGLRFFSRRLPGEVHRARHGTSNSRLLADDHGNVEVLGERECCIQRRHQKLMEEAPFAGCQPGAARATMDTLREAMRAIGYTNAGTVEFLMDEAGQAVLHRSERSNPGRASCDGSNHGCGFGKVTDSDRRRSETDGYPPQPITIRGHAIECRINAEHPETFVPSPGKITGFNLPGGIGVRVDTAVYAEGVVTPYYDSLVAKLIVHGKDREEAIERMKRALSMFVVEGIYTSIPLHLRILSDPRFIAGDLSTHFLNGYFKK